MVLDQVALRRIAEDIRETPDGLRIVHERLGLTAARAAVHPIGHHCGMWFRPMTFPAAGYMVEGHSHNYDHVTFLTLGVLHVKYFHAAKDGTPKSPMAERIFKAPVAIDIHAEMWHEFTALEGPAHATCIFVLRDHQGTPSDFIDHVPSSIT